MATYAIGDLQGCYSIFRKLLKKINFNVQKDQLWLVGDLVNRGLESLETLRYLYSIRENCSIVLGNHDIHLLAVAEHIRALNPKDTILPILQATDSKLWLHWLRQQPLLHHDVQRNILMVHAGIAPMWNLEQAKQYASWVEDDLRSIHYKKILQTLFRFPQVASWDQAKNRDQQKKIIADYFTRMRFCNAQGLLDYHNKTATSDYFLPWFHIKESPLYEAHIIFGHWSALEGKTNRKNIQAIDTGCVWGRSLTALNVDTFERIQVKHI